jgi:hypothetical protein
MAPQSSYDGRASPALRPALSISYVVKGLTVRPVAPAIPDFRIAAAVASDALLMATSK